MLGIYLHLWPVRSEYTQQRERNSERGQKMASHLQGLHNNPEWIHRIHDFLVSTSSHELHSQHGWFLVSIDCSDHWQLTWTKEMVIIWGSPFGENILILVYKSKAMLNTYISPMNRLGQTSSTWFPNLLPPYKTFCSSFTDGETALLSCMSFISHYTCIAFTH